MAIKTSEIPHRKRQILEHVKANPGTTAKDLSVALRISVENAEMFLFRLFRVVLVSRETVKTSSSRKPCFTYTVVQRGEARLTYWETQEGKPKRKRKLPESLGELAKIAGEPAKHKGMRTWKAKE